jgi:hypothetical protein
VAVLLVGSAVLVGCGGGDGDTETAAGGPGNPTASTVEPSGGSSGESSGGSGAITESRCIEAATAMAQAAAGIPQLFSGETQGLKDSLDSFAAFVDAAPSEIKDDLRIVADGYTAFVSVLADTDFNPATGQAPSADALAKIAAATEQLDNSDFEAAAERVTTWFEDKCGD